MSNLIEEILADQEYYDEERSACNRCYHWPQAHLNRSSRSIS